MTQINSEKRFIITSLLLIMVLAGHGSGIAGNSAGDPQPAGRQHGDVADIAVARVNGVDLTLTALIRRMDTIKMAKYGRQEVTEQLAQRVKTEAMEELITEEIVYQQAADLALAVTVEDVTRQITSLEENLGGKEHFDKYLRTIGFTMSQYRQEARRVIAVERLIAREIDDKIEIDDSILQQAYAQQQDQYVQKERVQVDDIVFFLDPGEKDALVRAGELRQKLMAAGDDGSEAPEEDGLYFIKKGITLNEQKEPDLFAAARKLTPRQYSEPLLSGGTIHIVRLTGYVPYRKQPFDEVKAELKQGLFNANRQQRLVEWLKDLRARARVEIVTPAGSIN